SQLRDGGSGERLTQRAQSVPWPCATSQVVGQGREMLPTRSLGIRAATGGQHMQMAMVVPMAAMRVEHGAGAPLERLPLDGAGAIVKAWRPAASQRTQHDRGVLVKGRAAHRRHPQDEMPRDDAVV